MNGGEFKGTRKVFWFRTHFATEFTETHICSGHLIMISNNLPQSQHFLSFPTSSEKQLMLTAKRCLGNSVIAGSVSNTSQGHRTDRDSIFQTPLVWTNSIEEHVTVSNVFNDLVFFAFSLDTIKTWLNILADCSLNSLSANLCRQKPSRYYRICVC